MDQGPSRGWNLVFIHEDDDLVAVVKPAGLPTANAPRGTPSLYSLLAERPGTGFVGIVSRLDAPVSGVVVVAKTPAAAASLAEQFRNRTVLKRYLAVIAGRFPAPLDQWVEWRDQMVRESEGNRSVIVAAGQGTKPGSGGLAAEPVGQAGGRRSTASRRNHGPLLPQEAVTRARVLARAGEVSLVELEPRTGRRHQLRVQLSHRGCPIVGDRQYGSRLPFPETGGVALHAADLDLEHPGTGRRLRLTAALPDGWRSRFSSLFSRSRPA
jgi:23S rRNA pseudouridine1911/1915/1917 synthase